MKHTHVTLNDKFINEAARGEKSSVGSVTAILLVMAFFVVGAGSLRNSPSVLLSSIERQANAAIVQANALDDYAEDDETLLEIENEIHLLSYLTAEAEDTNHMTPAKDAVEAYKSELTQLRERANGSLSAFKEAAAPYKEKEYKLTVKQRQLLREQGRLIRQNVHRAGKAKRATTAKEIAVAKQNGDTEALNRLYDEICVSIETDITQLNSALDKLDALTERLNEN